MLFSIICKFSKIINETGNYYHDLIAHDLKSMDIQCDQFVNPLAEPWNTAYHRWHEQIAQQ